MIKLTERELQSVQDKLEEGYTIISENTPSDDEIQGYPALQKVTRIFLYAPDKHLLLTYLVNSKQAQSEKLVAISSDDLKNEMVFVQEMQQTIENHRERYKLIILKGDSNVSDTLLVKKGSDYAIVSEDEARRNSGIQYEFEQTEIDVIQQSNRLNVINFNYISQESVG